MSQMFIYAILFFATFPVLILIAWVLDWYLPTTSELTAKRGDAKQLPPE